jgi:amino acid permease
VLALPYALRGMGWGPGLISLTVAFFVTYYNYVLMSKVLDHCESQGRRHIRFRELAADILGSFFFLLFFFSFVHPFVDQEVFVEVLHDEISPFLKDLDGCIISW